MPKDVQDERVIENYHKKEGRFFEVYGMYSFVFSMN